MNEVDDHFKAIYCYLCLNQGVPKVFSAGLDLVKEIYQPSDKKRLASFWSNFQEMWLRLYGSRLATMAAINVSYPFS